MTKQRYQHTISLDQEEEIRLQALMKDGRGLKGVFRRGLEIKEIEAGIVKIALKGKKP